MPDSLPTISVVVTCYNLGRYLDEAVDSVFAQTFQDFDIVVVDDGSTDPDTVALLADYRRPRTRVVRIENRGLPGARNEGIRRSQGRYVCCLDADDRLAPTYFEKAVAALEADPSIAFVSHWLRTFGDEEADWTPASADFPALLDVNTINGAALARRGALEAVGLFDETMRAGCEDWDLWIAMVERGMRGIILPEVLFHYRRRADSMSREMMQGDTHVGLYRRLIDKHRPAFEAHLADLIVRREIDEAAVLAELYDLTLDCDDVLGPEIERLRDGLRVARRKQARVERERETAAELARRAAAVEERDARLEAAQQQAAALDAALASERERSASLDAEFARERERSASLQAEAERRGVDAAGLEYQLERLRGTWSWKITRPIRALYSLLEKR